jgi:hypothetical protein
MSVRLPGSEGMSRAVLHPADGPARELDLDSDGDVHRLRLPDVGVYAVVELVGGSA